MNKDSLSHTQAVAVVGGAVAGAEIALRLAKSGILVAVFERNRHPFGKVEQGIPHWHSDQREAERGRILEKLTGPGIHFVPNTDIGKDIKFRDLAGGAWNFTAVILANGASRDRALGLGQVERDLAGGGLAYRREIVARFNQAWSEPTGTDVADLAQGGAVVLGGGLGAFDVAKILTLLSVRGALLALGIDVHVGVLERDGIPDVLAMHGLAWEDLAIEPCTVYCRRRIGDMAVLPVPAGADKTKRNRIEAARTQIVARVREKYNIEVVPLCTADGFEASGGALSAVSMRRTVIADGQLLSLAETFVHRTSLVVAAVGSVPESIPDIPTSGDYYAFDPKEPFTLAGHPKVFAVGNVLSGRGDFESSRRSARRVSQAAVESYLGIMPDRDEAKEPALFESSAEPMDEAVRRTHFCTHHSPEAMAELRQRIAARQNKVGYDGNLQEWIDS